MLNVRFGVVFVEEKLYLICVNSWSLCSIYIDGVWGLVWCLKGESLCKPGVKCKVWCGVL